MKRTLFTFAMFCTFSGGMVSANESCSTEVAKNGTNTNVLSADGTYLGYVSPNPDGSYFIWLEGKGAINETASDFQDAVNFVCTTSKTEVSH